MKMIKVEIEVEVGSTHFNSETMVMDKGFNGCYWVSPLPFLPPFLSLSLLLLILPSHCIPVSHSNQEIRISMIRTSLTSHSLPSSVSKTLTQLLS
jgi:hypothetical protein